MKNREKILTGFLMILFLLLICPMPLSAASYGQLADPVILSRDNANRVTQASWSCVWFGEYASHQIISDDPKSLDDNHGTKNPSYDMSYHIKDNSLYNQLASFDDSQWDEYNTCHYGGVKYYRVSELDYVDGEYVDVHAYFRYEPIKWRVLNISGDKALLLSEQCIVPGCHSRNSFRIDGAINTSFYGYFYNTAFSSKEKAAIIETDVFGIGENYSMFTLTREDAQNAAYGFSYNQEYPGRVATKTGFCNFANLHHTTPAGNCWGILNNPATDRYGQAIVKENGSIAGFVDYGTWGNTRIALYLNLDSDVYSYAGTVSSAGNVSEVEPEPTVDEDENPVVKFESGTVSLSSNTSMKSHNFHYEDDFFYSNSSAYNNELAVMSLGLELSSWTKNGSNYNTTYSANDTSCQRADYIKDAYEKLGFTKRSREYHNYNLSLDRTENKVAYSFAKKYIRSSRNPDQIDTLIAVVLRGGGYGAEWASNFNVGNSGDHKGFDEASLEVYLDLIEYLKDQKVTGDVKLWITGYSRAAAVSDLLAHRLNTNARALSLSDSNGNTIKRSNIFTYTFATPSGRRAGSKSGAKQVVDDNIFDIVSMNDVVPVIPLARWNFGKYGQVMRLPEYTPYVVEYSFKKLKGKDLNMSMCSKYTELFSTLAYDIAQNTSEYCKYYQTPIFNEMKNEFAKSSGSIIHAFTALPEVMIDSVDLSDYSLNDIAYKLGILTGGLKKLGKNGLYFNPKWSFNWSNQSLHLELNPSKIAIDAIGNTHEPEHYLSWLEYGSNSNYASSASTRKAVNSELASIFKETYKKYKVECPVDVTVTDAAGKIVGKIENNEVKVNDIPCMVDEDTKYFYLIGDQEYHVTLTGNDTGTMDYTVEEYNEDFESVRQVYYYDVPLKDGLAYTDTTDGKILNASEDYSMASSLGTTTKGFDSMDDSSTTYDIYTDDYGVAGAGSAKAGESVTLVATDRAGYEFTGWELDSADTTSDGQNVLKDSSSSVTTIRMPSHDIHIRSTWKMSSRPSSIKLDNKTATYTGNAIPMTGAVVTGSTGKVYYIYYSDVNCTKKLSGPPVNSGVYYVKATVEADDQYLTATSPVARFYIKKAEMQFKVTNNTVKIKASKLKKKAQTFKIKVTPAVKNTGQTLEFITIVGKDSRKFKVNQKTGKVTVKKKTKKGTYKAYIWVQYRERGNWTNSSKKVLVKVVVK